VITFDRVSVTYAGSPAPSLVDVSLEVPEGELVLVVGPTGSGKSTLLRTVNGLVPHFSGGTLSGRVTVAGLDTATHRPRDLATVVGLVEQNPTATFVTDVVEDEIAYGMETMGLDGAAIRRRVEETLDLFGLTPLRARALGALSGGQQQRVAIAALFAAGPRVLVLDEPTSALDPVAAEEVLASLHRIVHDLGVTVVLAEHRLERVVHHADRVVLIEDGRASGLLEPARRCCAHRSTRPSSGCPAWPAGRRHPCRSVTPAAARRPCASGSSARARSRLPSCGSSDPPPGSRSPACGSTAVGASSSTTSACVSRPAR
jgi:energy-coupling factor transporter ATP-binding protein EcfA2